MRMGRVRPTESRPRQDKICEPMADKKNRRTYRRVCFQSTGEGDAAFWSLNGLFGAAEGKVPLLMVCVKRKPLHLVFYAHVGESRNIIPRILVWRMPGSRVNRGFERCRGGGEGRVAQCRPGAIRVSFAGHERRLCPGASGGKARKWCNFGGWVWEVWRMGVEESPHRAALWKCGGSGELRGEQKTSEKRAGKRAGRRVKKRVERREWRQQGMLRRGRSIR